MSRTSHTQIWSFSNQSRVPTSRFPGAASSSPRYSAGSKFSSRTIVAAIPFSPSFRWVGAVLVAWGVQPEDEPRIPGTEAAQELRAVADLPAAGQQVAAERELPPLPGRQRGGAAAV